MSPKNLTCVDLLYISGLHLFPFRIKINLQRLHVYFYFCKIVLMFLWDCVLHTSSNQSVLMSALPPSNKETLQKYRYMLPWRAYLDWYYAMIKCKTLHHASMPLSNVIPHLFPLVSPSSLYCRLSIKGAQLSKKKIKNKTKFNKQHNTCTTLMVNPMVFFSQSLNEPVLNRYVSLKLSYQANRTDMSMVCFTTSKDFVRHLDTHFGKFTPVVCLWALWRCYLLYV